MFECNNLVHPFQNDPGVSQRQRVMDDLLSGSAQIDGRSMADLLDYFVQLSRHINYYNTNLTISDWQPFFQKSIPFSLAAIIKYNRNAVDRKVNAYNKLFDRHPSNAGIQLLLHYLFQQVIKRINDWHLQLKGSSLPAELIVEKLIKDKLREPLVKFICLHNVAVRLHCVKPINFLHLSENDVWGLTTAKLNPDTNECKPKGKTKRKRMTALRDKINDLFPAFIDSIRIIAGVAEQSMEQSFFPLKEELQEKHTPHLALLFSFLKLFQHLQGDLNKYTKKHLDFFYKQVLQLQPREATPDKLHLVFEIQKQLNKYLLKKGLLAKDGKDNNKAEVLFALGDEILVNKTQVADKRTLFLNNQDVFEYTYIEGVYMAPDAGKADGVEKDFKGDPKSFPTLGAKLSKYTNPEKTFAQPYLNARLGFILASPVLLLNEGKRTIDITLACRLSNNYCGDIEDTEPPASNNCCEESTPGILFNGTADNKFSAFISTPKFYSDIEAALKETYYYISEDLIREAAKKGIGKALENKLREFLIQTSKICYCNTEVRKYDRLITEDEWNSFLPNPTTEKELFDTVTAILSPIFKPRKALKVLFSGEKGWIEPVLPYSVTVSASPLPPDKKFLLKIGVALDPDQPAVTFYNKEKHEEKEDFNTTLPLVKIEMDDKVKLIFTNAELEDIVGNQNNDNCCLLKPSSGTGHFVSLYHFFRNVFVIDKIGSEETRIDVSVCGFKNFIVQNDESVQDVNAPVYPWGSRPTIIDFDAVNPRQGTKNLIGPDFYLGSSEIFLKKWGKLCVNLNWKDKPENFNEYYMAYLLRKNYHDCNDPNDNSKDISGLNECEFEVNIALLETGKWEKEDTTSGKGATNPVTNDYNRILFKKGACLNVCAAQLNPYDYSFFIEPADFGVTPQFIINNERLTKFEADTRYGFLRFSLQNQDFLHKDYAFVLSRQMMALSKFPKEGLEGAVYLKNGNTVIVFESIAPKLVELDDLVDDTKTAANASKGNVEDVNTRIGSARLLGSDEDENITDFEFLTNPDINTPLQSAVTNSDDASGFADDTRTKLDEIKSSLSIFDLITGELVDNLAVPIPNEPWTPIIKNISLDYTATATNTDIDLIHLYPYTGTYKHEELELQPTLLPVFCDEGTLFIGLQGLEPGSNVNMLFQLAEATADSESEREEIKWHYLDNNQWKQLRIGFEVLDDATDGLTTSGIVKFAFPENMTKDNTILPKDLHWIKASIPKNSKTISETIGIYTQAIRAIFTNETANDKLRLAQPLAAGEVSKLNEADANIKKLIQPHDSFGGRVPEGEGHFYVRVSELLRHKGKAIQKFDYERLALEAFPQLFKAKCINHSFALNAHEYINDFPIAPGYVLLAVIPDLNQLKASQSFEPRIPVSMLDDIQEYFKKRTSPFVRVRAMNPRYEKIQFCLKVKLYIGKEENYYKEKLKQDLRELLAPWAIGQYDKLTFGQCVSRSEVVRFLESRDYIDYIIDLKMKHEFPGSPEELLQVCPKTPRSILIAGDIDVCIPEKDCEQWQKCRDARGKEIDCCENEKIPFADYCPEIIIG